MPVQAEKSDRVLAWLAFLVGFGLPISTAFDNIAAGAFLLAWAVTGDWRQRWQRLSTNPASYAVVALLLLAAAGMAWSLGSTKETLRYFEKYAGLFLTLCIFTLPFDRSLRQTALRGFACGAFVTALVSFGKALAIRGVEPDVEGQCALPDEFIPRVTDFFDKCVVNVDINAVFQACDGDHIKRCLEYSLVTCLAGIER